MPYRTGPYRRATYTDIINHLRYQEYYEHFKDAQKFALELIGEQVAKVEICVWEEWDEDGPFTTIRSVSFYDDEGRSLTADFTLPAWDNYRASLPPNFAKLPYSEQLILASGYVNQCELYDAYFNGAPDEDTTFDLRHPPEEPTPLYIQE